MTRRESLTCIHEPFGDAFYFGPERLSERYEHDEKAREESGFAQSTYKTIFERLEREATEVRFHRSYMFLLILVLLSEPFFTPYWLGGRTNFTCFTINSEQQSNVLFATFPSITQTSTVSLRFIVSSALIAYCFYGLDIVNFICITKWRSNKFWTSSAFTFFCWFWVVQIILRKTHRYIE